MSGFRPPSNASSNGLKVNSRAAAAGGFSGAPTGGGTPAPGAALGAPGVAAPGEEAKAEPEAEDVTRVRTFDMFWVERKALMYQSGSKKTFDKKTRMKSFEKKWASSIPIILRDMSPPENSIFNPQEKWNQKKEERAIQDKMRLLAIEEDAKNNLDRSKLSKQELKKLADKEKKEAKEAKKNSKTNELSKTDQMRAKNSNRIEKENHAKDMEKMTSNVTLDQVFHAKVDTDSGRLKRMLKMLQIAVKSLQVGSPNASLAEVFDIMWALEELKLFNDAEFALAQQKKEKDEKKKTKETDGKKDKKSKDKKDSKKSKKKDDEEGSKSSLTPQQEELGSILKSLYDDDKNIKEAVKFARKEMEKKKKEELMTSFQLTEMSDRLPPLSRYNRKFNLEDWQCNVLEKIDERQSAVVCAPTSSGKTLLSTYTCAMAKGKTVLFVLPSEVLVWQVAATYYQFFKGHVTICTDLINFQNGDGDNKAQVYIGTPRALETALTKARGCAGEEMVTGEREFMVLDGGFGDFGYMVLDEVHTLNGPEGDALQRIIRATRCPILALSATIGNASQMKDWFQLVRNEQVEVIEGGAVDNVILEEYFARFINLQRYVVANQEIKNNKTGETESKKRLVKLHPVLAMTRKRLEEESDLVGSLSLTPVDMMDIWRKMKKIFPAGSLREEDDPDHFFKSVDGGGSSRINLLQTKKYETRIKEILTELSGKYPEDYEKMRLSFSAGAIDDLQKSDDVSDELYGTISELQRKELLPAVAFQMSTFGAFQMFKSLLRATELAQNEEFPHWRENLVKTAEENERLRQIAAGKAEKNEKEATEDAKDGQAPLTESDVNKPHEKYCFTSKGGIIPYVKVEEIRNDMIKAGEDVDINHALIRGLRRGIAIYTNEIGFACYRRWVQILAQQGFLAVVFSDDALAYGVNMPFRSCIFCGDMGPALTPLIAQQMQGRAGRRGMDVQGNVIYLGMVWNTIENLMLGQISKVTGNDPYYPVMALQGVLAASNDPDDDLYYAHPRNYSKDPGDDDSTIKRKRFSNAIHTLQRSLHCYPTVDETSMSHMATNRLSDFCAGRDKGVDYLEMSHYVIQELGFVDAARRIVMDHNVLTMVFELRDSLPEVLAVVEALPMLYEIFIRDKKHRPSSKDGKIKIKESSQNLFLSVLVHLIDRTPCLEGDTPLHKMLKCGDLEAGKLVDEDSLETWTATENVLKSIRFKISSMTIPEEEKQRMQIGLPGGSGGGGGDFGPSLDAGVYHMLSTNAVGFPKDMSVARRNELKERIFKFGQFCRVASNNIQQPTGSFHGDYTSLSVFFRKLFSATKYSVTDIMRQLTDQVDECIV